MRRTTTTQNEPPDPWRVYEAMMLDTLVDFPLRGATDDQLGTALALCQREFMLWHSQALAIAKFPADAKLAGVHSVFEERNRAMLGYGAAAGYITYTAAKTRSDAEIAAIIVEPQLETIEHSARVAAVVLLHSAFEKLLWQFVRFAIVSQRKKAVERIEKRQVTVGELSAGEPEALIDQQLEKWWAELERATLPKKWDMLVSLLGSPDKLRDDAWHFDKEMLVEFDDVRHDCVHHSGTKLRTFDFDSFASQLSRAMMVWLIEVTVPLNVTIPGEIMFMGARPS